MVFSTPRINMTIYGIFVCLFYASKIIKFNIKKREYLVFTLVKFEIIYFHYMESRYRYLLRIYNTS